MAYANNSQTSTYNKTWHLFFLHKDMHLIQIRLNQTYDVFKGTLSGDSQKQHGLGAVALDCRHPISNWQGSLCTNH
jgi:hypothetical protein